MFMAKHTKHTTTWQDGGDAGFICDNDTKVNQSISDGRSENCEVCGQTLILMWDVRLVEINNEQT
jgi:hypothetical protein